jgi:AcrR family transcriptional regulator
MSSEPARPYHSPRRLRESLRTRQGILDAALALFAEQGYADVTVAGIAARAEVAVRTVYTKFDSKAEILAAVIDRAAELSGGAEVVGEVRRTDDAREVLRLLASGTRAANERNQTLFDLVRSTASSPEARGLRCRLTASYIALLREAAEHLHALDALRPGMSASEAGEVLWFCFGLDAWTTTTRDLGQDWETAQAWLLRRAEQMLLQGR